MDESISQFQNKIIVFDMATPYVCIGTLTGEDHRYYILEDADIHDLRDSATTRELYVLDTKKHGVGVNRSKAWVRKDDVVSLSLLADVKE